MTSRVSPAAIGRWSSRHPWRAITAWSVFVVVAVALLAISGSKALASGAAGESARAEAILKQHRSQPAQFEYAYLHSATLQVSAPAFHTAIANVQSDLNAGLGGHATTTVSSSGHSALVTARIGRPFATNQLAAAVAHAGDASITAILDDNNTGGTGGNSDLQRAERLSVPVTLLVLLIAFGALIAALVPVLLGATVVVAAFGLLGPISQVFPLDPAVKTVLILIGMAVGVDYALFYVVRSREERARGLGSHDALARTARTSGHAVLVAGTTVAIAMAGQFLLGSPITNGLAAATIAVVACAVAGSLTVLPAVLELLGPRIDRGQIHFLPHLGASGESRMWSGIVDRVLRRPKLALVVATGILAALAVPALGLHVADPPSSLTSPRVARSLQAQINRDFPGTSSPALVVFSFPSTERARAEHAAQTLARQAVATGVGHQPFTLGGSGDGRAGTLELPLSGLGDDNASKHALHVLRVTLIPQTLALVPGVKVAVTGDAAQDVDRTRQFTHGLPYVIGFVLLLAFLLLLFTFRSIVIPIKAIVLNLLSVAASYGVLVLIFQHHWAQGFLGFHDTGSIIAWLPVFLFVVLFGLSMDYHVFILNRVREGIDNGMANDEALRHGIERTAGVVTSAALVMVGVFSLFGTANSLDLKQAGVGLAVAVLLDATLIRAVLLPATMKLLGDWNWYLPRWLQRPSGPAKQADAAPAMVTTTADAQA